MIAKPPYKVSSSPIKSIYWRIINCATKLNLTHLRGVVKNAEFMSKKTRNRCNAAIVAKAAQFE